MASKNKRKGGSTREDAGTSPRQEVERLIAKGWFKDAIKQAKICHRDQPSPEHHRLLERAYLLRARELRVGGMATAAREVMANLLDFGVTDPDLTEDVASLAIAVGLVEAALKFTGRLDSPEAIERLGRQAADQAVLRPELAGATTPEARAGGQRVRAALEALDAGDEARALDHLRDVARASPFADWRLFVRGLAAARRGDHTEARSNWDRLDPARAAARIAAPLIAIHDGDSPTKGTAAAAQREKLERWAFGEPLLGPLRDLQEMAGQGRWADVTGRLGPVRLALRRFDPNLAIRLTRALIEPLTIEAMDQGYQAGKTLIERFTKVTEPLPIDPHWYRLWALVWEGPQGDIEEAEPFWRKYVQQLDSVAAIRPEDRNRVRALILTHLGQVFAGFAANDDPRISVRAMIDPERERDRRRAINYFEESLRLFPDHRATYQELMDLFDDADQPDRVAEVAHRLLEAFPDDLDALQLLTANHFRHDRPAVALDFALRARKLKPLDRSALENEWGSRVALARQLALQGQWDRGRTELATAASLLPDRSRTPHFIARQIALELRAGQGDVARGLLDDALSQLSETGSLRLSLAIEARRFQLPEREVARFDAGWATEVPKKVRADTAGALAELIGSFLAGGIDYPGRGDHAREVVGYLSRTTRIKYGRDDLLHVCEFLLQMKTEHELGQKLAKRGLKLFPDAPEFPAFMGMIEIEKGVRHANFRLARTHLETALRLALPREATDPRVAAIIPQIKKILSTLESATGGGLGFPFGAPGPAPSGKGISSPSEILAALAEMMGEDADLDDLHFSIPADDEDDEDDEDDAPAATPRPRPKGKKR